MEKVEIQKMLRLNQYLLQIIKDCNCELNKRKRKSNVKNVSTQTDE